MGDMTSEEMRATVVPKSDQLNADDLLTGPVTVTVEGVRPGKDKEQPVCVDVSGYPGRPYKPCKTMRRVLIAAWGDDPKPWIGRRMTLYRDPEVMWGGLKQGGIRISHLSDIEGTRTFVLTQTRGKKAEFVIKALETISPEDRKYIEEVLDEIAKADTPEILKAIAFAVKSKPKAVVDAVSGAGAKKAAELKAKESKS